MDNDDVFEDSTEGLAFLPVKHELICHSPQEPSQTRPRLVKQPAESECLFDEKSLASIGSDDEFNDEPSVEDEKFAESFGIKLGPEKSQIKTFDVIETRRANFKRFVEAQESTNQTCSDINKPTAQLKNSFTSECVYHKGTFYQIGDIVALCDQEDHQVYFAQLTGFLQDQFCEKSASLNWLIPTQPASRTVFDISCYRPAFEDPQLRKLDCMTFVRHCPHDYYQNLQLKNSNYPQEQLELATNRRSSKNARPFIWTTMRPCEVPDIQIE